MYLSFLVRTKDVANWAVGVAITQVE